MSLGIPAAPPAWQLSCAASQRKRTHAGARCNKQVRSYRVVPEDALQMSKVWCGPSICLAVLLLSLNVAREESGVNLVSVYERKLPETGSDILLTQPSESIRIPLEALKQLHSARSKPTQTPLTTFSLYSLCPIAPNPFSDAVPAISASCKDGVRSVSIHFVFDVRAAQRRSPSPGTRAAPFPGCSRRGEPPCADSVLAHVVIPNCNVASSVSSYRLPRSW